MSADVKKVGVILHILKDQPWAELVKKDIENGLLHKPGIEVEFADPLGKAMRQVEFAEKFLAEGVAALVILPIDADRIKPVLRKFKDARVPVVVLDCEVDDPELYDSLILADNLQFGRKVGEFFVDVLGGRGKIVEILGIRSTTGAKDRATGFREAFEDHSGIEIVDQISADWLYENAKQEFKRVLDRVEQIDGVFAQDDEMGRGAYDVAAEVGREDEMLIVGIDGLRGEDGGIKLVMTGKFAATFINPSSGKDAVDAVLKLLRGETPLKKTLLYTSPFKSNQRIEKWRKDHRRI
jgi:ABC-type sugar transport system substrate-binding protein